MCSGLFTNSAKGAIAARASSAPGEWTSSRTLQSLWTISAFPDALVLVTGLRPNGVQERCVWRICTAVRGRKRPACRLSQLHEVSSFLRGTFERGFGGRRYGKVTISRPHAVFPHPRIVGEKGGQRGICAFDQSGQAPVLEFRAPLGSVIEQPCNRVRKLQGASCREEFANLGHRSSLFDSGEQLACIQPPHVLGDPHGIGVEG